MMYKRHKRAVLKSYSILVELAFSDKNVKCKKNTMVIWKRECYILILTCFSLAPRLVFTYACTNKIGKKTSTESGNLHKRISKYLVIISKNLNEFFLGHNSTTWQYKYNWKQSNIGKWLIISFEQKITIHIFEYTSVYEKIGTTEGCYGRKYAGKAIGKATKKFKSLWTTNQGNQIKRSAYLTVQWIFFVICTHRKISVIDVIYSKALTNRPKL